MTPKDLHVKQAVRNDITAYFRSSSFFFFRITYFGDEVGEKIFFFVDLRLSDSDGSLLVFDCFFEIV